MIYKNQFFISNNLANDQINNLKLKFIKLNSNKYLYYRNLNFQIFNENERQIILIGFCLQSDPCKKQNLNDIFNEPIEDIEIVLSTLVGNFIVIYNGMIYKDIGNLYKLFYYKHNDEIIISNNALLFKNVLKIDLGKVSKFGGHTRRYCPAGKSCFSMVKSLYNTQNIDLNGKIHHNSLIKDKIVTKLTINNFVKMHTDYSCQIIRNLYKNIKDNKKRLFLTLTGGRDSRMILAVCLYLKIPFEVITFKIKNQDVEIAEEICQKYNLKHTIINFKLFNVNSNIKNDWENIIGEEFVERDNQIIQKQVLESIMDQGDSIIFGNGPEWCSRTNAAGCNHINSEEYYEYKKWIDNHKEKIHWKNRLFLENRVGSWLSSIQHSYDMCSKIQRFSFPLSEKIVASSFFLGPERNKVSINEGLIKLLMPELNNIRYK